ncbi:MAG: hypothetical protein AAFV53_37030 [Myxococcota bacterium]
MTGIIPTFLLSSLVEAAEPVIASTDVGPAAEIGLSYSSADADAMASLWAADRALLKRYVSRAEVIVIGQVISTRPDLAVAGEQEIATLLVEQRLRGDVVGLVEFRAPLERRGRQLRPTIVEGYRLLLFLEPGANVLDGEAIFFIEGGHAWRNRRERVFLRPSVDRLWHSEIDPIEDYIALSLDEVHATIAATPKVVEHKNRRRRGR